VASYVAELAGVTVPLPLPDDTRLSELVRDWPTDFAGLPWTMYPRSLWLHEYERILREHYPQASSKQLTLTARLAAPFPLAKPGVP